MFRAIDVARRDLPHWTTEEGTYFVTFRLFDSLTEDIARLRSVRRVEAALDRGQGSAFMLIPAIGSMVFNSLREFDRERYWLHTACVMPNHVHVVFRTAPGVALPDVMRTWKGYTACRANQILGRKGPFWQRESYDRLLRDQHEFDHANAYVLANPGKAGLSDWKWVGAFDPVFRVRYEGEQAGGLLHT
jgi:REP element-mobilizing transposase RayT